MSRTQLRGICQCCGRQQAVVRGNMSKHGYTVENGWFRGVCSGDMHKPVEKDRSVLDAVVKSVRADCVALAEKVETWKAGTAHPEKVRTGNLVNGKEVLISWEEANELQRRKGLERAIYGTESRIRAGRSFADTMERIGDQYHGQPLVEVEIKDAPAPVQVGEKKQGAKRVLTVYRVQGARVYHKDDAGFKGWTGIQAWRKLPDVAE